MNAISSVFVYIVIIFLNVDLVRPKSRVGAAKEMIKIINDIRNLEKQTFINRPIIIFFQKEFEEMAKAFVKENMKVDRIEYVVHQIGEQSMDSLLQYWLTEREGVIITMFNRNNTESWITMMQDSRFRFLKLNAMIYTEHRHHQHKYNLICTPEKQVAIVYNNAKNKSGDVHTLFTTGIYNEISIKKREKCKHSIPSDVSHGHPKFTYQYIYVGYEKKNPYFKFHVVNETRIAENRGDDDKDDREGDDEMDPRKINGTKLIVDGFEAQLIHTLLTQHAVNNSRFVQMLKPCSAKTIKCSTLPDSFGPHRNLIDMLLDMQADMAISRIALNEEIIRNMDYSPVYFIDRFVILSRTRTLTNSGDLIFKPVEPKFWYLILLAMFIVAPSYVVMERHLRPHTEQLTPTGFVSKTFVGLFYTYRTFFGFVRCENHPHISLRIFSLAWAVSGLIFGICYSSMFTAALSSNLIQTNINSLSQLKRELQAKETSLLLKKSDNIIIGPINNAMNDTIYSEIYEIAHGKGLLTIVSRDKLIPHMMKNPKAALIIDHLSSYAIANQLQNHTKRSFHISSELFGWEMYAIIRRRGFYNGRKWDNYLWNIMESGVLDYWYQYDNLYQQYQYKASQARRKDDVPLRLTHFRALCYIYALGIGTTGFAFIFEIVIAKCKLWKMKPKLENPAYDYAKHKIHYIKVPALVFR